MCGIAGFLTTDPHPDDRHVLERMTAALAHRGPDDCGFFTSGPVFLGHRRLSIIDLETGHQPLGNEDGTRWIVYNGEIFNHAALRPELEAAGHRYRSRADTETILHAYEQYGPACLDRLRGMFAFALWDARAGALFCARDRLGIKPFYYFFDGRRFAFASEIKALLEHPALRAELDETQLSEYLAFGYTSGEETLFRGVRKLLPGHRMLLEYNGDGLRRRLEPYWEPPCPAPAAARQPARHWIRECRRRLEETVRMRLMSDVPLGMFLSGGLDSSAIAALMARLAPGPIQTFSVGYPEARFSELGFARQAAAHIHSEHREVVVGLRDFFNALPKLVWHEDEPLTWPSSVSLYFVARLAAQHVKVVLTGEGSDELFAGYARYPRFLFNQRWLPGYRRLPAGLREALRRWVASTSLLRADWRRKLQHTFLGLRDDLTALLLDNFYCAFSAEAQQGFLRKAASPPYRNFLRYWEAFQGAHPLQRLLCADQKTYLVELLMKQDQMSMACSIESRVPLLDHTFVEFAARVPPELKLRGTGKYIVKKAVEDLLPRRLIYRRKMGFPTPLRQWLRDPQARPLYALLRDPQGLLAEYVSPEALEQLITQHLAGQHDGADRLWRLLNLQIWGHLFLTRRLTPASQDLIP
jgi:asparagine synthase (glutamine-hydrolysing)